ncbi:hypothetical protein BC835DRAFT_1418683 [Cytidiella melzeri]|nr:hypothetical protein BC835DRAFT_1418683 [Cytidiella melzeri]
MPLPARATPTPSPPQPTFAVHDADANEPEENEQNDSVPSTPIPERVDLPEHPPAPTPTTPMVLDEEYLFDLEPTPEMGPHEPVTQKPRELEFASPTQGFELPAGNDPCFAYNTLSEDQAEEWPRTPGATFLVRLAGKGCPTSQTEKARKEETLSILRRTVGAPKDIRIVAPASANPHGGNKAPPHNFLIHNVSEQYYDYIRAYGACISTVEGTLFFSPNHPLFDSYVGSIDGFDDADEQQIYGLVSKAIDKQNVTGLLEYLVIGEEHLAHLTPDEAVNTIRSSLRVTIVEAKGQDTDSHRVAHLFMDPPTSDITRWRKFRDTIMGAKFKDPILGMYIAAFKGWHCGICTSMLHPTPICPIIVEKGWLYDKNIRASPNAAKPPPPATSQAAFTTMEQGQGERSARESRGGRGRGGRGRGSRGRGGRGRNI